MNEIEYNIVLQFRMPPTIVPTVMMMKTIWTVLSLSSLWEMNSVHGFVSPLLLEKNHHRSSSSLCLLTEECLAFGRRQKHDRRRRRRTTSLYGSLEEDDEEDDDDEDDDDYIDTDSLGDWRNFRRSLTVGEHDDDDTAGDASATSSKTLLEAFSSEREVTENEMILQSQNKKLAEEYASGVWAHETATPEVGGLVIRMPLEVELYRNYKHSIMGSKLRAMLVDDGAKTGATIDDLDMSHWYGRSRDLIEEQMKEIADLADEEGQIDATTLPEGYAEMMQLYLDNQEQWQEVCLVLEQTTSQKGSHSAKTVVLNRPMAFKLTKELGKIVLMGGYSEETTKEKAKELTRFMVAFSEECAVYVGGPDRQGGPAVMIHGISDLPGAVEISPGAKIYKGGLPAAVDGVLEGKYDPLEFRFFVGCHDYEESLLDIQVLLGKYQPIACSRTLALKQCISLPKPLWHEVMELCEDGDLPDISTLEANKHDEMSFQILEDDSDDDDDALGIFLGDDDDDFDIEIMDDDEDDAPFGW